MKSYKQFISESINISGDFNGNLYMNSTQDSPQQVEETYVADITWMGSIYRLEFVSDPSPPVHWSSENACKYWAKPGHLHNPFDPWSFFVWLAGKKRGDHLPLVSPAARGLGVAALRSPPSAAAG